MLTTSETNVTEEPAPVTYKLWNNADENSEVQKNCDSIKIKTKYVFHGEYTLFEIAH